jgi:hypothetical protein
MPSWIWDAGFPVHDLAQYFRTAGLKHHPKVASTGNPVEVGKLGEDALPALGWQHH